MTKPFTTPFAADAPDNLFIPETAQPDGSVSYETGFGPDYSKDPLENGAKPVPRKGHNELFFQITGSIGDIQRQGAADWYPEFAADGGYPKNAIVWLDGDRWKSQIDGNTTRPNIDEIAWLPSAKFEGGGGGGGGDFGLTGPTTIAVGGSFQYKISPYSSFMTYAVSATNGTATISGDTITLTIAPGETANVTDLTVVRSDGARNDFRIAIGAQSIAKPSMLSPVSGSVDVPLGPLMTASAFMTYPDGVDTHLNTDWRIRTMAGAVVWQSLENAVNKTNIQVPDNTLPLNTQLQADVRYRGATLPVSAWSDAVTFTTTNQSISTPTITAPLNGATGIGATPTFTSTAFATNPLGADNHASSDWQLKNSLGVVIWSSVADVVNKTSITLPSGVLAVSSQYTMEVRYNGNVLQPSQWSPVVSFTTVAQFAYDKYLAVGQATTPFLNIYGQDVDTFTKLASIDTIPTSQINQIATSPDGQYIACAVSSAPFVVIYKRAGDSFLRLANPSTLPTGVAFGLSFSHDGIYLAVGHSSAPYITVYKRSGDVFSKLPNNSLITNAVTSVSFFNGLNSFLTSKSTGNSLLVINIESDALSLGVAIANAGTSNKPSISPTLQYVVAPTNTTPYIRVYKRNSETSYTELSIAQGSELTSTGLCSAFSPDGNYFAAGTTNTPFLAMYKRSGDVFSKLPGPDTLPTGQVNDISFSLDGTHLSCAHNSSPFVTIYRKSGDALTKIANPSSLPSAAGRSVSFNPPVPGV